MQYRGIIFVLSSKTAQILDLPLIAAADPLRNQKYLLKLVKIINAGPDRQDQGNRQNNQADFLKKGERQQFDRKDQDTQGRILQHRFYLMAPGRTAFKNEAGVKTTKNNLRISENLCRPPINCPVNCNFLQSVWKDRVSFYTPGKKAGPS